MADKVKELTIPYPSVSMDMLVNQVYGGYLLGYNMIRIKATRRFHLKTLIGLRRLCESWSA